MIGRSFCGSRHQGTLADIAISATTQDTPQFGVQALRDALQIGQSLHHCIGRMCVVHHGQGQFNAFNTDHLFHATRHRLQTCTDLDHLVQGQLQCTQRSHHTQHIVDVVVTHQMGLQMHTLLIFLHIKSHAMGCAL